MLAKDAVVLIVEMFQPDDEIVIRYDGTPYDVSTIGRGPVGPDGPMVISIIAETDDEDDDEEDEFDDEDDESDDELGDTNVTFHSGAGRLRTTSANQEQSGKRSRSTSRTRSSYRSQKGRRRFRPYA